MTNVILHGRIALDKLQPLITNCHFPAEALVLMEQFPRHVVTSRAERQELLQFTFFSPELAFAKYTSGRIFQDSGELRWEQEHDQAHVVFVGDEDKLSTTVAALLRDYHLDDEALPALNIDIQHPQQKKYYLFGIRLQKEDLEKIGSVAKPGDFAQVRIHRLLRYALKNIDTPGPVCFTVQEWYDNATGQLVLFRFVGLDEQPVQHEQNAQDKEATTR